MLHSTTIDNRILFYKYIARELVFLDTITSSESGKTTLPIENHHKKTAGISKSFKAKKLKCVTTGCLFEIPLNSLPFCKNDATLGLAVPRFVLDACNVIRKQISTEGLFRKAGSSIRQKEIRAHLSSGGTFEDHYHVIDVANVLKYFLRVLPEPLIPFEFHKLLRRCLCLETPARLEDALLKVCHLIPPEHLSTLTYVMQFMSEVSSHSPENKMDTHNLSVVLSPSLMPVCRPIQMNNGIPARNSSGLLMNNECLVLSQQHVQVIEVLLTNSTLVGMISSDIEEKISTLVDDNVFIDTNSDVGTGKIGKRRKRRSGSITRVLNGLWRKVGGGKLEVLSGNSQQTHETPVVAMKRRAHSHDNLLGISIKKKKTVIETLPTESVLSSQHKKLNFVDDKICVTCNTVPKLQPKKFFKTPLKNSNNTESSSFRCRSRSVHSPIKEASKDVPHLNKKKGIRRHKSCLYSENDTLPSVKKFVSENNLPMAIDIEVHQTPEKFICEAQVSLSEDEISAYDATNVSKLSLEPQQHLSILNYSGNTTYIIKEDTETKEKEQVNEVVNSPNEELFDNFALLSTSDRNLLVQTAFNRTEKETGKILDSLSNSANQKKTPRSPSQRKIKMVKRRSQENQIPVTNSPHDSSYLTRSALKRGQPNTVRSGLTRPHGVSRRSVPESAMVNILNDKKSARCNVQKRRSFRHLVCRQDSISPTTPLVSTTPTHVKRSHSSVKELVNQLQKNHTPSPCKIAWKSAEHYFESPRTPLLGHHMSCDVTGRPSVVKLRELNAGKVSDNVKKFDNLVTTKKINLDYIPPAVYIVSPLKESNRLNNFPVIKPNLTPLNYNEFQTPRVNKQKSTSGRQKTPIKVLPY